MARHRDDVQVHLQGDQDPARGSVGQHVGQQVGGVALGDVGSSAGPAVESAPRPG